MADTTVSGTSNTAAVTPKDTSLTPTAVDQMKSGDVSAADAKQSKTIDFDKIKQFLMNVNPYGQAAHDKAMEAIRNIRS